MANKRLNAVITIGGAVSSSLKSALGTTKSKIVEIGGAIRQLQREQRNLADGIGTFGRMGKDVDGLRARYAAVTAEIERQQRALGRLKSLEASRQANLEKRSQLRGKIGETAALGAAIVLPAGAAVKRSSDFNYQLQAIGNTADMSKAQVVSLGTEILKVSDEVGKSAQTVQGALGFLVAAGMEVGTARGVIRSVGRTATATASEIEDVAKASFTLNDALKIQPGKMQQALDMLVQSGKEGNFEFKDMAAELPVLGAGLQALKMTGTEAVATIGAALQIARKGAGSSAQAATNVENFLAKILSPETLKKANKLGSDLYGVVSGAQQRGENPFEAAIQEINRVTKGGDQKLLGELFQDMQVQNFLRPMLQNLEEYDRIKKAALSADGVTDRDFQKMAATTKQQLDEMGNAAGRAAIAFGNSLEPAVGRVVAVLTPVVRTITDFVNGNQALVGNTILAAGAFTTLRLATLVTGFAFTFIRGGALSLIGAAIRLAPAIGYVATAVMWLGRALLMNPIGLAVTAIAGAAYLIYKNWDPIKAWFATLWSDITATFQTALAWITQKIDWVGQKWQATKAFFGVGAKATLGAALPADQGGTAAGAPTLPSVPPMAMRGAGAAAPVTDNRQFNFNVAQQPGQSTKELADEIERRMRAQQGVRSRSIMYDTVTP
jgi:TP901 family phage tail tape measure protein